MRIITILALVLAMGSNVSKAQTKKRSSERPASRGKSGADKEEGWIIKRTAKGIVKIPKSQTFKFSGSDVEGQAQSPSQTVLGKRPKPRPATLIPERQNFRNEFQESSGL